MKDIDTIFRQVRFTHIAFFASTLIYGIIGIFLKLFITGSEPGFVTLDPSTYWLLVILCVIISVGLGFVILVVLAKPSSPQHLVKSEAMATSAQLGQALSKVHFLRMILAEAIAIFGLVLFFLGGNLLHLLAFVGLGLVLLVLIYPHKAEWDEARRSLMEKS